MSTSITSPTSLATFSIPHASSSKLPHVTLNPVHDSEASSQRLAVAAVQGDGVWTYDLRTLRPTTSYTVPPSTTFSTPPISFFTSKGKAKQTTESMDLDESITQETGPIRVTAVAVQNGEGVEKKNEGRVVWCWRGEEGSEKLKVTLDHPISFLQYTQFPSYPIVAIHSSQHLTLLSSDLEILKLEPTNSPTASTKIIASHIDILPPNYVRLTILDQQGSFWMYGIENKSEIPTARCNVTGKIVGDVRIFVSGDISSEGIITAIDEKNNIISRNVKDQSSFPTNYPQLAHPSSQPTMLSIPTIGKPISLIPSSHPTPSLLLVIPSSTMPALISSSAISTLSTSGSISQLALLGRTSSQTYYVGVVLHHPSSNNEDGGRSVIYITEVSIPEKGVGLNALLGTQAKTQDYITVTTPQTSKAVEPLKKSFDQLNEELTRLLGKGEISKATTRWKEWLDKTDQENKNRKVILPEAYVRQIVKIVFSAALPNSDVESGESVKVVAKKAFYASGVMTSLLERRVVGDEMWIGGVVAGGLLPLGDWKNILIALPLLPTIPSSALIKLLQSSLHPSTGQTPPPVDALLKAILALPTPAPTYRYELQKGLTVEDATIILNIMVGYAENWVAFSSKGIKWEVELEEGESSMTGSEDQPSPSLEAVLNHSSLLLDAHTPSFLSHPPSHSLLSRLQSAIEPLLALQTDYRALRAPLEAVLTLAKREAQKQKERERKREIQIGAMGNSASGYSAGLKHQSKQKNMLNGDEKMGKWKVEDIVF